MRTRELRHDEVEIIFFDGDGTAVPEGAKTAPPEVIRAVDSVRPQILRALFTGRIYADAGGLLDTLPIDYAAINGGAYLLEKRDGDVYSVPNDEAYPDLYQPCLTPKAVRSVLSHLSVVCYGESGMPAIEKSGLSLLATLGSKAPDGPLLAKAASSSEIARFLGTVELSAKSTPIGWIDMEGLPIITALKGGEDPALESLFLRDIPDSDKAYAIAADLSERFTGEITAHAVTAQDPKYCDVQIVGNKASKRHAALLLCHIRGIDPRKTVLIGDGPNDPIGEGPWFSVAMGNAKKSVQEKAHRVIGTQKSGAFVSFLGEFATCD